MKSWTMPEVAELTISNTFYGGTPNNELDNSYINQDNVTIVNFLPERQQS